MTDITQLFHPRKVSDVVDECWKIVLSELIDGPIPILIVIISEVGVPFENSSVVSTPYVETFFGEVEGK